MFTLFPKKEKKTFTIGFNGPSDVSYMARAKQDFDGKSQTERHFRRTNISLDLSRKIVWEVRLIDTCSFISIFVLYSFIWSYCSILLQYSLKNTSVIETYRPKYFLITQTAATTVKRTDLSSRCSGVSFGGKSPSARISSHLLIRTFLCLLFFFICLWNWLRFTDSDIVWQNE